MTAVQKVLASLATLYLLSGAPGVLHGLRSSGALRVVAAAHGAMALAGVAGLLLSFSNSPWFSRTLSLLGIGLASLIYATHRLTIAFPAPIRFPLTFGSRYSGGRFSQFGVDVVPAAIFIAIWLVARKPRVRDALKTSRPIASLRGNTT